MFTGIIEELGKIQRITSGKITIECKIILENTKIGDSIAVNGVCLTVSEILAGGFTAEVSPETFKVTAFRELCAGDFVNLERAMKADGCFGGHIVQGHVDGCGKFVSAVRHGDFYDLKIELTENQLKYIVKKGSVSINGISLTIAEINGNAIRAAIIPHTFEYTNLKYLKNGDFVNIEVDILSKYVEKFLLTRDNRSRLDLAFLQENGF